MLYMRRAKMKKMGMTGDVVEIQNESVETVSERKLSLCMEQ